MNELRLVEHNVHRVAVEGRQMLFHIPTSSLFELDQVSGELLDMFAPDAAGEAGPSGISADDVRHRFDGRHPPDTVVETIQEFLDLEVLSDGRPLHPDHVSIEVKNFPLSTIVLNTNSGCNLSCTYCYKEDLAAPANGTKMSFDTAVKSIEMLLAEGETRDRFNIVFFGGEPLSNMPLIRQVVDYAEARADEIGKKVDFLLTTNATLLTEEIVDYFNDHRFGLTISMDGPQAIHDRNRRTVGGGGSYEVVAEKARMVLSRFNARPVGARVTLTAGITDVVGIWHHLVNELGFHEVGFAPVTSTENTLFALNGDELIDLFDSMKELGRRYVEAAIEGRNIGFGNLHQLMSDLSEGMTKSLPCGAGVGLLAVDTEGGVNLCHRFTGSDLPTFGHVDHGGIDKPALGKFIESRLDRTDTGCETCRIRNLCSGGCYHESYARYNDPIHPTYHYCDLMRDWVDFGIEAYSRIMERNPSFFQTYVEPRRAKS
jgi:uncharacterized protein